MLIEALLQRVRVLVQPPVPWFSAEPAFLPSTQMSAVKALVSWLSAAL